MTLMLAVLAGTQVMFWKIEHREFQQSLPVEVRAELDDLTARGLEDGPRAMQIYGEYWAVDPMRGESSRCCSPCCSGCRWAWRPGSSSRR